MKSAVIPVANFFYGQNVSLAWSDSAQQYAMLYGVLISTVPTTLLTRFTIDGTVIVTNALSTSTTYRPTGLAYRLLPLGSTYYIAIWEAERIGGSTDNTSAGLVSSQVKQSDGTVAAAQRILRDPLLSGAASYPAAVLGGNDPNDPNDLSVGVFWTDSRDPNNPSNVCRAVIGTTCKGQTYFRRIRLVANGGQDPNEYLLSTDSAQAAQPSAVWNPQGAYFEAAWTDFGTAPGGSADPDARRRSFSSASRSKAFESINRNLMRRGMQREIVGRSEFAAGPDRAWTLSRRDGASDPDDWRNRHRSAFRVSHSVR